MHRVTIEQTTPENKVVKTLEKIKALAAALSIIVLAQGAIVGAAKAQAAPPPAGSARLTVVFTGIAITQGAIRTALFDSEATYDGAGAPAGAIESRVSDNTIRLTFEGLTPGRYAIKAFHDLNGDGKLNVNLFGVPTEPYAFSNGAQAVMGPPAWGEAAFVVGGGDNTQTIIIR